MYTLDTNAIIYYLKGDKNAVKTFRDIFSRAVPIYISAVTELELFSFQSLSSQELENIENILKTVVTISLDSRIARIGGSLRRQHRLKVPDSIIAATAMLTGTILITRNIKDFRKISALQLLRI